VNSEVACSISETRLWKAEFIDSFEEVLWKDFKNLRIICFVVTLTIALKVIARVKFQ
jgi:hypothetical protein